MAFLIYYYLLRRSWSAVAASGATYITPNVASLMIGWTTGEKVVALEIAAIILVLASIAMLPLGVKSAQSKQRAEQAKGPALMGLYII